MVDLAHTSIPPWAVSPLVQDVDPTAREIWIHAVGDTDPVRSVVTQWCAEAAVASTSEREILMHVEVFQDAGAAVAAATSTTAAAAVGARLMIAGTANDCAAVRAAALQQGWTDEEIRIGSTSALDRMVTCTHCATTTLTSAQIDGSFRCPGCARSLLVYYHFSRRTGSYLGFMSDAEDAAPAAAAGAAS